MKNIETILSELGIQIPADKKDAFNSQFGENYKTTEETNRAEAADPDRDRGKSEVGLIGRNAFCRSSFV